jgi:uncharacterized SAM-binding protein YcdF (DUF218 family)
VIRRVLAVLVLAYVAVAAYLFLFPHDDKPVHADAIVVLAGTKQRLPVGERLYRQGYAPVLVVSLSRPAGRVQLEACRRGAICFRGDPFSTRGEARAIARLAAQRHWKTIDVVTSKFHDFRARVLVERCYHGRLRMIGAPQSTLHLPIDVAKESAKLVYQELFARGC